MEEIITYGQNNPNLNPLNLWGWPIAVYLFLGGLAAGILIFASLTYLMGKEDQFPVSIRYAPLLVPPALIIGLGCLFFDLHHKLYVWNIYLSFRIESPMSWGAWTLLFVTPVSILWALRYYLDENPKWLKYSRLDRIKAWVMKHQKSLAWIQLGLATLLGIYTGILLSAFNARPLWNTGLLGILFLVSGLSTGAVVIYWMSKTSEEKKLFRYLDTFLIVTELILIVHLFMGLLAGSEVMVRAADLFLGGEFTLVFWLGVVTVGLVIPLILELLEISGKKIPVYLVPILVLIGGMYLRIIIVYAGQISSYSNLGG